MTQIDEKPTLGERYTRAAGSSNLRVGEHENGADMLIAAGWLQREGQLGALLFRLRAEFEQVDSTIRVADKLEPGAVKSPTQRLMVWMNLDSLRETKEALGRFALVQATKQKFMRRDREVLALVGQVLDIHLDPLCHHCGARGFFGGAHRGEKQTICRPCRGTGFRKEGIGKDREQYVFGRFLLGEMERLLARAAGGIGYRLRGPRD